MQLYRSFVSQSSEFYHHNLLCCFSTSNTNGKRIFRYRLSPETFGYNLHIRWKWVNEFWVSRSDRYPSGVPGTHRIRDRRQTVPLMPEIGWEWSAHRAVKTCTRNFYFENLKWIDHLERLHVDGSYRNSVKLWNWLTGSGYVPMWL